MATPNGQVKVYVQGIKNERNLYKGLEQIMKQYAQEIVEETLEFAVNEAQDLIENAEYDGVNDVVATKETFKYGGRITLRGDALPYIEYGTGVYGEGYNKGEFNAFGRHSEKIKAGYQELKTKEAEANANVRLGKQKDISQEIKATKQYVKDHKRSLKGWFYTAKPGDKLTTPKGRIPTYRNPYLTSRYTRGNRANHIVDKLEKAIKREIPRIARRIKIRETI